VAAGKVVLTEADAFFLPDTQGTDYRAQHTKTTIGIETIDIDAKKLGYFHNAGYYTLEGADFVGLFRLDLPPDPTFMPLFAEFMRVDRVERLPAPELAQRSIAILRRELSHRPATNPLTAFKHAFVKDVERLKGVGLATVCDVWLNGQHVLRSDNMFHEHAIDVTSLVGEKNELTLRFHALAALLQARRPRPRWKTKLIDHQQLRWFRTTLLGRIPGWTPPANAVGPWRAVSLERRSLLAIEDVDLRTSVDEASGGKDGVVRVSLRVRGLAGHAVQSATLHVGEAHAPLTFHDAGASKDADGVWSASGEARVRGVPHEGRVEPAAGGARA
jgi:hypothetical protein